MLNLVSELYSQKKEAPDRRVVVINIRKEPQKGLGVNIVGGENTGGLDLGIFVQSLVPGGPAARDGRLRAGDRIIAINGQSLEGMPHSVAMELIRQSPPTVQLMVSQSLHRPPDYSSDLEDSLEDLTVSSSTAQVHQERSVEGHEADGTEVIQPNKYKYLYTSKVLL